jgi:hypothetical protein
MSAMAIEFVVAFCSIESIFVEVVIIADDKVEPIIKKGLLDKSKLGIALSNKALLEI